MMAKILIVEDDHNIASFLSTLLLGAGYECLSASTSERARVLLNSEENIALVILDQNLGKDSDTGLELLSALRQSSHHQGVPVIICSGDSRQAIVAGFLSQHIAGFVKKPFRGDRLLADVDRVIAAHQPAPVAVEVKVVGRA
jgi:two-component system, OmpR family, alkaline phosphatase synthesis response regulator PhoP